jgi:hypothetical protein
MIAALTLDDVLASSRAHELQTAIVATLKARFPWCTVTAHPGRLDINDIAAADAFKAPGLAVAIISHKRPDRSTSGLRQVALDVAVYIVVEDRAVGARRIDRAQLGQALCDALLDVLADDGLARFGLPQIEYPDGAEGKPLFTAVTRTGAAYYAVSWSQTVWVAGPATWDFESPPPPGIEDSRVILPGDPEPEDPSPQEPSP